MGCAVVHTYIIYAVAYFLHSLRISVFELVVIPAVAQPLHHFGEKGVFELVHTRRKGFGGVVALHAALGLKQRYALVEV